MVVSYHVHAGIHIWVLWTSGVHSYPLSHLSRLSPDFPKTCYMDKDSFEASRICWTAENLSHRPRASEMPELLTSAALSAYSCPSIQ